LRKCPRKADAAKAARGNDPEEGVKFLSTGSPDQRKVSDLMRYQGKSAELIKNAETRKNT